MDMTELIGHSRAVLFLTGPPIDLVVIFMAMAE
jgi:hypothetical protein